RRAGPPGPGKGGGHPGRPGSPGARSGDAAGRPGGTALVAGAGRAGRVRRPPQRHAGLRSIPVTRAVLFATALALASRAGAAAVSEPCAAASGAQGPDDPELREWLRALVHEVAREEGVDPYALEALGMTETTLQPALGRSCELGPFQVMPWWAGIFRLDSPLPP